MIILNQLSQSSNELGGSFSMARVEYALQMTLLGLGAVFAVLAIMWLLLSIFKIVMYDIPERKAKANVVQSVESEKVIEATAKEVAVVNHNDDATIAVIMAAISAYISSDPQLAQEYSNGFRVVSFKRVRDKSSWNSKK